MEKVEPTSTLYGSWTCNLNENQVRACGHFSDKNQITVSVDKNQLNRFGMLKRNRYITQNHDGSYDCLKAEWSIDENRLLAHWFLANCPLDWTSEEEEEEEEEVW